MADVKEEYEDYEVVFFRRTEKEEEEEEKQESFESYQYRLQSKRHRNMMMESLSFKNLSREEEEDEDEETNPSPSKTNAKTLAPTSPLNNLSSLENMEHEPVVVPYFRRIEIVGTKEEPTGTREIFDLWFPASAVDEKDLNRFSGYAQTVIKRYNKVKKTDFEFVRLVKMRWTLGHFYLRFKAKAKSSGAATLKTFEGDVRCNWCLVNEEDGRPLSCRLIGRKFDDYLYVRPPPWYH
ncbi:uncharacterized protein LOC112004206 [Quercus suber]|uniref:Uncharacterized protein n=1 Tax=Quercus suber TaxID=58331 RepID=A0AAW0LCL6_QUESU|nr:uncharacterized protein LOC112004206 [Quercus suber]